MLVQNDMLLTFLLASCTYSGNSYDCPAKSNDWLNMSYGEQWRVPHSRHGGYVETPQSRVGKGGASPVTYTVRSGDPAWSVGTRFGIQATDIMRWNKVLNPTSINANDVWRLTPPAR